MPTSAQHSINTIEQFIQRLGGSVKSAEAHTEPGSIGGETEHPVKDVDDKTDAAQTGDRAAENETDVKEEVGETSVDSTPEAKAASAAIRLLKGANTYCGQGQSMTPGNQGGKKPLKKKAEGGAASTPGSAADDQIQQGTNKQPTGEDPSNETGKAKGGKEDPGSDHPARTDNDSLEGGKYAYDADTPLEKIASDIKVLGERICTRIYNSLDDGPAQGGHYHQQPQHKQAADPVFGDARLAYQAGDELAALLNGTMDKQAADQMVHRSLMEIIKTASDDADRYGMYFVEMERQRQYAQKFAAGEIPPEMLAGGDASGGGLPGGGGGEMPPGADMAAEMGGGGGGEDPAALLAALGGGEAAEDPGAGGDPMAGGDPGAGGEGGEGIPPEALAQLLEELGVGEEDIAGAAEEEAGLEEGAEGDLPPPDPAAGAGAGAGGPKMGSDHGGYKTGGKRAAKQGGRKSAGDTVDFFRELISRSKAAQR